MCDYAALQPAIRAGEERPMDMKLDRAQPLSKIDREIVNTLIETKAINFEALGKAIASVGPASVLADDDGWIRWCGNDLRIYRWPRPRFGLEELTVLRDIVRELSLPSAGPAVGGTVLNR
jgi:hypothetical protein